MKSITVVLLFCSIILNAQSREGIPIAEVGNITITDTEFLYRYELTPGLNRTRNRTENDKTAFLLSLIAEKLLVLKAEQEGWESDSAAMANISEVERLLVRDELYRREVSQRVSVSEQELSVGMQRARIDLKIYFLFSDTKEGADFLYGQIAKGKSLEDFSFDSTAEEFAGPDSLIARWGEIDERMEEVIYALPLNTASAPVAADDGWYIVKVMGKSVTVIAGEKERAALRERVESTIRKRKELSRMSDYMQSALGAKKAEINARILKSVIVHLWSDAQKRNPRRPDTAMYFVDQFAVDGLRRQLRDTMNIALVTMPHAVWSADQAMERIRETNLATVRPTMQRIRIDVEQRLREIIDQEFLAEIGYETGLHQSNAVRNDMKVWRDAYRAQIVRSRINDTIAVTRGEIDEIRRVFGSDTSIARNDDKAKEKVFEIKSNLSVDRTAGAIANATTIKVYEENFRNLRVSSTPSMVFRYIGFGGRMFAVPFVIPQTGWIRFWDTRNISLP